jgi:ATP-dependent protease ClpP protease subunit
VVRKYSFIRGEGDAAKSATLYLYDFVGFDPWSGGGVTAKKVIDDLAALGQVDAIDVRVNSPGGDVFDGVAIYNALARNPAKVTVHVDGLAASIASLIAMAGDEIRVAENAMFMVHQPWTIAIGDAPEMRRVAEALDKAWSSMLATYQRRTGRRAETITKKVADAGGEWWLTAEEAVAQGFADVVAAPSKDAEAFGLARFRKAPERLGGSAAKDDAVRAWTPPEVLELVTPRVARTPEGPDPEQLRRRRIVDVLRLT